MARYLVPAGPHRVEHEVLRSRFITTVNRASSVDEARALISAQREEFVGASHTCWAYLVGPPGATGTIGLSDDGEPHGTAGRPIFEVISHARVGDIVAAVTRYFGGTLLGKGGLVRAYSQGVVEALAAMDTVEKVRRVLVALEIEYGHMSRVRKLLTSFDARLLSEVHGATVGYQLDVAEHRVDELQRALTDATSGDLLFELLQGEPLA
ncbi:MAG: YigZ family protein [Deltaproteobacteria bacterium]|nr:YigZ family protein [Deltaproteobacteria bacterium]